MREKRHPRFAAFPIGEGGPRQRRSGALVNDALETIFPALFHTASTLSGSLRSPPSPRGEGFVSGIPLSPSNLRPFGAPPSIGRREHPREPLPLEGAAERSEAGLASFFAAKPPPLCLPHRGGGTASAVDRVLSYIVDLRRISSLFFMPLVPYPARSARHLPHAGKALSVVIVFPHMRVFVLTMREKRYSRIVAFPIWEGGPRQRRSGALASGALETISPTLFHTASTLSGSLRSPPSPRGEGFVRRYSFSPRILYSL